MSLAPAYGETRPLTFDYQKLVNAAFALFIFSGVISVIEPSPYDFMALIAIPLWFFGGFRLHPALIPILALYVFLRDRRLRLLSFRIGTNRPGALPAPVALSLLTAVVLLHFLSNARRACGALSESIRARRSRCSLFGLLSYFDVAGMYDLFVTVEGRVNGTFKDPNVYGSYMVLAAAYLMHATILGRKRILLTIPSLAAVCVGVFLSFSRGSWGATLLAMIVVTIAAYVTTDDSGRGGVSCGCPRPHRDRTHRHSRGLSTMTRVNSF